MDSREAGTKSVRPFREGISEVEILLPFDYEYDDFPQELTLFFEAKYDKQVPSVSLIWLTSDGREISLERREGGPPYRISLDTDLRRRLGEQAPGSGTFPGSGRRGAVSPQGCLRVAGQGATV